MQSTGGWRKRKSSRRTPGMLAALEATRLEVSPGMTRLPLDTEATRLEMSPGTHGVLADGRERFEEKVLDKDILKEDVA